MRRQKKAPARRRGRRFGVRTRDGLREVVAMFQAGMPIAEIADVWGTTPENVRRCLQRRGLVTPARRTGPFRGDRRRFEQRRDTIYRLIGQRLSYLHIAAALRLYPPHLLRWMRRWLPEAVKHVLVVPDKHASEWRRRLVHAGQARRRGRQLSAGGTTLPIAEWARRARIAARTIRRRLALGAAPEEAILPARCWRRRRPS